MSKFNSYGKRLNEVYRSKAEAYRKAEAAFKKAEQARNATPQRGGMVDAQYAAKAARAQADYLEAKEELNKAKRALQDGINDIKAIRKDLAAECDRAFALDADSIDSNSIELLKSGIMGVNDYARMYEKAEADGNRTMMRLIGSYAEKAAAKAHSQQDAQALRVLGFKGKENEANSVLEAFDALSYAYERAVDNPSMFNYWETDLQAKINDF